MSEWVATRFVQKDDLDGHIMLPITIDRLQSPLYGGTRFAVRCGNECLTKGGKWLWEPLPSSRTEYFLKRTRFESFEQAQKAAEKARILRYML